MPIEERRKMIKQDHTQLSVRSQCQLLDLYRSTVYYQPTPKMDDPIVMNTIHELWLKHPYYGYRRITQQLKRDGHDINYKRIRRLMRTMNLQAIYPKKKLSQPNKEHHIYPYLLKDLAITEPNQVWASDITYIKLPHGFVYLVCLIDLYSRYIVSWELSNCLSTDFCISMFERAVKTTTPEIINTDQGAQFTSQAWIDSLTKKEIKVSMDGAGRCMDNIHIERFWRTLKYEDINLMVYETVSEAYHGIKKFIDFYNNERLHSSLKYRPPFELYNTQKSEGNSGECNKLNISNQILMAPIF